MHDYCLYGIALTTDIDLFAYPVPRGAPAPGEHAALTLRQTVNPSESACYTETHPLYTAHGRELVLHTDRPLARSEPGQPWCLEVQEVVSFTWIGGEDTIEYHLHDKGSPTLLAFWFVHIFLPLYLTLERGYDFIHSAAVEVDEQPILFIAPSTGGKSTLGDYFLKQGHTLLSDDKVATFLHEGQFWAVPSHPHHRPWREFEVLGDPVARFARSARPVHAFYVLEQGEPDSEVEIIEQTGFRKFEQLYPHYLFNFRFLEVQRMRWLATLADQCQVFVVTRPWDLERIYEGYEAICAHSRGLA